MGNRNLDSLRQLGAKYWQVIITFVTAILAGLKVFYDWKTPRLQTAVVVFVGLFVIIIIRFPRVAIGLTKLIFGPPPPPPNPPKIFRGPLPYLSGEKLPGRQTEMQTCWLALQQKPFLLLEGESGCGKSSILNAALLLAARAAFSVVECRVGEDPFGKLTCALEGRPYRAAEGTYDARSLLEAVKSAANNHAGTHGGEDNRKTLLICIDQFEELFVTVKDSVRTSFVETLRDMVASGHARLVLGMRSDFSDLLSRLCRTVDSEQKSLDMGSYYTLKAFSAARARDVLEQMLEPLDNDDPLRKQQLNSFSISLVNELLRPPRDKRLNQEDEKTVLPVELQTVGMMLESVGVENFSTEGYRRLGRKAGLLRAYIEEAKSYVWRKTGVSGDQALLILRQLISPARTKWEQTPDSVGKTLSLPPQQVKSVLDAFAEKFLVNRLPTESNDGADGALSLKYELMHEHLVHILVEAPQPILQKARDAEERLHFWRERTQELFSTPRNGFRRFLPPQPIPLMESLRLRRFATDDALKQMLTRNYLGFGVKFLIGLILPLTLAGVGWTLWTRSDSYQIREVVRTAPSGAVAVNESSFLDSISTVINWSRALIYAERTDAAFDSLRALRDLNLRANGFTAIAASLAKTGDGDRALVAVKESLDSDDVKWADSRHAPLVEVAERFGHAGRSEDLLKVIRDAGATNLRVNAFWAASEGFLKAGKADDASRAFSEALASANYMKVAKERSDKLIMLAEKTEEAGRHAEAVRALNDARATLSALSETDDRTSNQIKIAGVFAKLNDIKQASSLVNELLGSKVIRWDSDITIILSTIVERMAHSGKASEALGFLAKETFGGYGKVYLRRAVVNGLADAGKIDDVLSAIGNSQNLWEVLPLLSYASEASIKKGDMTGARRFVEKLLSVRSTLNLHPEDLSAYRIFRDSPDPFSIIDSATKVGQTERVIQFAQTLEPQWTLSIGLTDTTPLAYVAERLVESRQVDKGLQAAGSISSSRMKSSVSYKAASVLIEAGNFGRAMEILHAALEFRKNAAGDANITTSDDLKEIALAFAKAGKVEEARKVLLMMSDENMRLGAGTDVVSTLVKAGREDDAGNIALNSTDEATRSQLLADLAVSLAQVGKGEKALPVLDKIKYADDSSRARAAVAKWQARQGNFLAARATAQPCSDWGKLDAYTILMLEYAKKRRPDLASQFVIEEEKTVSEDE